MAASVFAALLPVGEQSAEVHAGGGNPGDDNQSDSGGHQYGGRVYRLAVLQRDDDSEKPVLRGVVGVDKTPRTNPDHQGCRRSVEELVHRWESIHNRTVDPSQYGGDAFRVPNLNCSVGAQVASVEQLAKESGLKYVNGKVG